VKKTLYSLLTALFLFSATIANAELVNINNADAETIAFHLKGIGEARANAIVAFREQNGLFRSIEEIQNVPGIGDKTFDNIKADLSVDRGASSLE
jgi:competence protein ComEA